MYSFEVLVLKLLSILLGLRCVFSIGLYICYVPARKCIFICLHIYK
jgi:hypothetical protein